MLRQQLLILVSHDNSASNADQGMNLVFGVSAFMLRIEAAEILKEILVTCGNIEGKSIKLMPPDADSVLSKGC